MNQINIGPLTVGSLNTGQIRRTSGPQITSEVPTNWSSISEQKIFDPIIHAMSRLHKTDNKVERIVLTPKKHAELMSFERMNKTVIITFKSGEDFGVENVREDNTPRKELWGARIEVGEKSAVYSRFGQISEGINWFFKNIAIHVKSRAACVHMHKVTKEEYKALDTLREMISEFQFRRYLKYGFIVVKGQSGDIYQIPRIGNHTKIWRNGTLVEEVCVRIADDKIPLTDDVIAFKTIIETNEDEFKKMGNVYKMQKVQKVA